MKYWLLTSEYPPFFGGGISTYCRITVEMFAANGHDVTVFLNDAAVRDFASEQRGNIRVVRFNTSRTKSSAFLGHTTNISYEFASILKDFILKEGKPDLIEAQEYLGIAYYLLQYKKLLYDWCRDIPILITMHSPSFLYMEYNHVSLYRYPNYWICEMERFCLQAADQVVSPSQFMIDELAKRFKLTNAHLSLIPNPFFPVAKAKMIEGVEPNEIVFFGKLTVQKGAFKLLAYFKKLWDEGFVRPLFLLGGQDIVYHPEGASMGDIIKRKYKNYIKNGLLKLEDKINPADIAARLSAAEVVIIPSNNDNLPYVVFEMMDLGKIVLVSRQGGHVEVVQDGHDGFIFDHNHPDTFALQLNRILNLSKDQREIISGYAKQKVQSEYSPEKIYSKKIVLIEALLKRKGISNKQFPFIRMENTPANQIEESLTNRRLLSIVIPYFNMEKYIDETIESIQKSLYTNLEIIVVNDGSTGEESLLKLESYRSRKNIRVIDTKNEGLAMARNTGATAATGRYLTFLDADDLIDPNYYLRSIQVLEEYDNVSFVGCWGQYFDSSSYIWPSFQPEPPLILYHNLVNSSSLVYKRADFLKGGLNDNKMIFQGLEDYDSVISMISNNLPGVIIPEPLFNYRIRPDSMIRNISKEKKLILYEYIVTKHNRFYSNFAADIFNLVNANGSAVSMDNPSLDRHLMDKLPFGGKLSIKFIGLIKRNRHIKTIAYKIYRSLNKK